MAKNILVFNDTTLKKERSTVTEDIVNAVRNEIRMSGFSQMGSTNTSLVNFASVDINTGSNITLTNTAANGTTIAIGADGIYMASLSFSNDAAGNSVGFSLNPSGGQKSTDAPSLPASVALIFAHFAHSSSGRAQVISWSGFLANGDEFAVHGTGGDGGGTSNNWHFNFVKLQNL